jgi:hypothetical protein
MSIHDGTESQKGIRLMIGFVGLIVILGLSYYMLVPSLNLPRQTVECKVPSELTLKYDSNPATDVTLKNTFWACNGLVCNRLMAPQEWVNKYCFSQDGVNLCRLSTPQGNILVPLNQINVTAIKECAEYLCMQEVLVRNASYIIPAQ